MVFVAVLAVLNLGLGFAIAVALAYQYRRHCLSEKKSSEDVRPGL